MSHPIEPKHRPGIERIVEPTSRLPHACTWRRACAAALCLALAPAPASAANFDYGFLKDAFADARAAARGEASVTDDAGSFSAINNPATLARHARSSLAVSRATLFDDELDGVDLARWGAVTGWGPIAIGLTYSTLDWGSFEVPEDFFSLEGTRSFEVKEEEFRAGIGVSLDDPLARLLQRPVPFEVEVGAALSRFELQVPSAGDPADAVPVDATLHSLDLGTVLSYHWEIADPSTASTPLRRASVRVGVLGRDLTSPADDLEPGRRLEFERVMRYGSSASFEFGDAGRFGPWVTLGVGLQRASSRHADPGSWETGWYGEMDLLGVFSARRGTVRDPALGIDDTTYGFGLALDWEGLPVGVRLDWAERPLVHFDGRVVVDRFGSTVVGASTPKESLFTLAVTTALPHARTSSR